MHETDMLSFVRHLVLLALLTALQAGCEERSSTLPLPEVIAESTPADASWTVFADDPERLFEQARRLYFAGDADRAANTVRRSTKPLTIWIHRTDDAPAKSTLYVANSRLRSLADDIEHHRIDRIESFERAFALAHYALARAHEAIAKADVAEDPRMGGQSLVESVSHLQFGLRWAGHEDSERDAAHGIDIMAVAVRLITGDSIDESATVAAFDELSSELGLLERAARHPRGDGVDLSVDEGEALETSESALVVFADEPDGTFHEAMHFIDVGQPHGVEAELRMAAAWVDLMASRSPTEIAEPLFEIVRDLEADATRAHELDHPSAARLFAITHCRIARASLAGAEAALRDGQPARAEQMCRVAASHLWSAGLWCECLTRGAERDAIRDALDPQRDIGDLDSLIGILRAAADRMVRHEQNETGATRSEESS